MSLKEFRNVREQYMLYDTLGVWDPPQGSGITNPDGWVANFAALGALNTIPFFNVRNRSAGLYWNNQEKRDQLDWPFIIESLGVTFHAMPITGIVSWATGSTLRPEDSASHIFVNDLPRHVGVRVKVQQDERLKTHAFFCQPGYGVSGDGYGRGAPSTWGAPISDNGWDHHLAVHSQGLPQLDNRWHFPLPLEVPRNASLSVVLEINEYGRALLAYLPWRVTAFGNTDELTGDIKLIQPFAYIQVSLIGKRLVQQRGQYHR